MPQAPEGPRKVKKKKSVGDAISGVKKDTSFGVVPERNKARAKSQRVQRKVANEIATTKPLSRGKLRQVGGDVPKVVAPKPFRLVDPVSRPAKVKAKKDEKSTIRQVQAVSDKARKDLNERGGSKAKFEKRDRAIETLKTVKDLPGTSRVDEYQAKYDREQRKRRLREQREAARVAAHKKNARTAADTDPTPRTKRADPRAHPASAAGLNLSPLGKKTAAAGLVGIQQLNRIASAEGQGAYQAIRAVKTGKSPTVEYAKGAAKGFKENKSGHAKAFHELGVPRKPAAVLGFTADVVLDPTTYVTAGAAGAAKTAVKAAGQGAAKKVVKKGLDKAAAESEVRRAAAEAAKKRSRREASARAVASQPESSAIKEQRAQLADLEERGHGGSKKAQNIRKNLDRSGKRKAKRSVPKPVADAPSAEGAAKSFVSRRKRAAERVEGKKPKPRGRVVHVGIGKARVKVKVGRGVLGERPVKDSKWRPVVNQVSPRTRPLGSVDQDAYEGALAVNRSRRAGENVAGHEAQVTATVLRQVFPRMSDSDAAAWVKAHESGDLSFAPKHLVEGSDGTYADAVAELRKATDVKDAAVRDAAARGAGHDDPLVQAADRHVQEAWEAVGRAKKGGKPRLKGQREVELATDRGRKAVQRSGQPIGDIELKKGPTLAKLEAESAELAGKTPSGKRVTPVVARDATPQEVRRWEKEAAAKGAVIDTRRAEIEKTIDDVERRAGVQNDPTFDPDTAENMPGLRELYRLRDQIEREAQGTRRAARERSARRVVAKPSQSAGGRGRDVTAYVKKMEQADAAQNYYPQGVAAKDVPPPAHADGLIGKSPSAHTMRREDPRIIDAKNPERVAEGKPPLSTNPVLDVANYELGTKRVASRAKAQTKLADQGIAVKFGRVPTAAPRAAGQKTARPTGIRRYTSDEFNAKHQLGPSHPHNKVFFLGSRDGKYGLHEVDEKAVDKMRQAGRQSENGRYVVLDERLIDTALGGPTGRISGTTPLGTFYDRFTGGYRKISISTPAYNAVNQMGDTWIMYTVVPGSKVIPYQKKALPVVRFLQAQEAGKTAKARELGARLIEVDGEQMTVAQLAKEVMGEGAARQGHYARLEDIQHFAETSVKPARRGAGPFRAVGRSLRSREDWNRIGTYLYLRDQGEEPAAAADRMLGALIDYGEMSKAEREVFRRAALFYTFPARQIPYQTKALFRSPGKFATYEKARRNTGYAFDVPPDQLENEAYFKQAQLGLPYRVGPGKNGVRYAEWQTPANMLNMSLPLGMNAHPALSLKDGPVGNGTQFLGGMLNPLPKVPIELITGYNLFFRQPIQSETSPSTPAPSWVVSLAKVNPAVVKELGLVQKPDKVTGKMTWQWNKTPNYLLSQATPGPLKLATDLARPSNQRGLTKKEQLFKFATGIRAEHSDVRGEQITRMYRQYKALDGREQVLNTSTLEGGKEWKALKAGKIDLGAQILTESWLREDKKLLDPENLLPRALKDRRPSKAQLGFVLKKAEFKKRAALQGGGSGSPGVPSLPSVPSIP